MKFLVVVDEQVDFTTGCLGNDECAATIPIVCDIIRKGNYDRVYVTQDTHQTNYLDTQEGQKLPVEHCIQGTDGWKIVDDVWSACCETYQGKDLVTICKPSFGSLALGSMLQADAPVDEDLEIDFVGVCTGICVISNVMIAKAALPEAKICVIEKACACVTPESHKTAINAMRTCQVDII